MNHKKGAKHPKSLWRDESLIPRMLEQNENIFEIIMPWVKEEQEEISKAKDQEASAKGPKQQTLSSFFTKGKKQDKQGKSAAGGKKRGKAVDDDD